MAELTTEQIVKVVIAALVIVIVLSGIYLIFRDRIYSYFVDIVPDERDLTNTYYQQLIREENLVARTTLDARKNVIEVKEGTSYKRTTFYFWKQSGEIYDGRSARFFGVVKGDLAGSVDKNGIVRIEARFAGSEISVLDGAEKIGRGMYKTGGAYGK